MTYDATVIEVLISTPSDVRAEREIIRDVIGDWNAANSRHWGMVLSPVGWEKHSHPEMGESPQGVINRTIGENADLLVAVFHTRIGTPTGEHESGTVEEIRNHLALGRPAMIYFSRVPVGMDQVDENQYKALRSFELECKTNGLVWTYQSTDEFRSELRRHLDQMVNEYFAQSHTIASSSSSYEDPELSSAAWKILRAAEQDPNNIVLFMRMSYGLEVASNSEKLNTVGDPRSEKLYKSAVEELERQGLIEQEDTNEQVYGITQEGYQLLDSVKGGNG